MKNAIRFMFTVAIISIAAIGNATTFNCSASDINSIHQKIKLHLLANAVVSPQDVVITSEKCLSDYASAKVTARNNSIDPATVYLNKKHNQWKVLSMGTSFDKKFLDDIPKEIQQ